MALPVPLPYPLPVFSATSKLSDRILVTKLQETLQSVPETGKGRGPGPGMHNHLAVAPLAPLSFSSLLPPQGPSTWSR
jgi:hypothetical protein